MPAGSAGREFATAAVGVYDSTTGLLFYSAAGHPPPLLRRAASAEVMRLDESRGPVLGLLDDAGYTESSVPVEDGDVLVMYSDGLVEHEGCEIQAGIEHLERVLAHWPPEALLDCEALAEAVVPTPRTDDICLVIVRFGLAPRTDAGVIGWPTWTRPEEVCAAAELPPVRFPGGLACRTTGPRGRTVRSGLRGVRCRIAAHLAFFGATIGPAFFPATGVTVAAMLLVRRAQWPVVLAAIALAECLIDLYFGEPFPQILGYVLADWLVPVVGATVVLRWCKGRPDLPRRRDLTAFLVGACSIGPLAGGMLGGWATPGR